ncbi:site-2 protease family protein [Patescibacteria group bacterium]|nr:site-2 protease family protein [Patescibacteria group bacterium]MBU2220100.1 site-2 protease family protein [Patescibacteria group bacterium]MBU2264870.1 site-2 protease family protein [Patescibacteria group bacterium]
MLAVIVFIIILGLLVFVHELGHFLAAKKTGMRVEEFGFGFPPRLVSVKKGETIYSLNLIPLGGFVKIFGEDGEEKKSTHSFAAKPIWQRAAVLLAGVTMNIGLAIALLSLGYMIGLPVGVDDNFTVSNAQVQITEVAPASPAEKAGIKIGDIILGASSASGQLANVEQVVEFQNYIALNKGQEIVVLLKRGQADRQVALTPRIEAPLNEGAMGVGLVRVAKISWPWYRAIWEGAKETFILIWLIISSLGYLIWQFFSTGHGAGQVVGPVGIFSITGQAAQMGFIYLLQLTAFLTVNLAIINALPFPALDGGRVLFLIIEKIKGSPVSETVEKAIHTAGFAFLILLMVVITLKDIVRLF